MPNRILRDWTDSEKIDQLDVHTERFFTRLIMKVDDFGRYSANLKLLKSHLYPLKSDIRETDIARWITACEKSGIIVVYMVAQKEYLQINDFKQVLRQKHEKYPSPDSCGASAMQMTSIRQASASLKRNETNQETEVEEEVPQAAHTPLEIDLFKKFQEWMNKHTPRVTQMKEPLTIDQFLRLKTKLNREKLKELLMAMQNYQPLLKKSISANLTIQKWAKSDFSHQKPEQNASTAAQGQKITEDKSARILFGTLRQGASPSQ